MWNLRNFVLVLHFIAIVLWPTTARKLSRKHFVTLHEWTNLEVSFPTPEDLNYALSHGYYDKSKLVPVDVDMEYGDDGLFRTFLTIPRLNVGVPYSLATISEEDSYIKLNPKLVPYPNYEWHRSYGSNCSGITSAIRTTIDDCWRLWVIDSGQINSMQHCPPQILAFDLVSDKLVHRFKLPLHLYTPGVSVFTALTVDVGNSEPINECRDTTVYIADPWAYGLIVYDALAGRSWRIEHDLMRPNRKLQNAFSSSDGIFTVSLSVREALESEPETSAERQLYFHALNSYTEVSVPLHIVNNASLWTSSKNVSMEALREFRIVGSRGTQCESEAMDNAGHLYCSLISSNALVSWKQGTNYNSDNLQVVAYSPEQLKFVTGLKINVNAAEEDELWALSNDPRLFIGGRVKEGDVKFQIIGCRTRNLLNAELCSVQATEMKFKLKHKNILTSK